MLLCISIHTGKQTTPEAKECSLRGPEVIDSCELDKVGAGTELT